jgi:hypothetical protein
VLVGALSACKGLASLVGTVSVLVGAVRVLEVPESAYMSGESA